MKHSQLLQHMLRVAGIGAATAMVVGVSGEALAGIKDTKHNLSSDNAVNNNWVDGSRAGTEICVFCHTPHGASTTVKAPLWNKANTVSDYTVYASTTMDATVNQPGSISLACLSCHDGTQAMDSMINKPGSGFRTTDANTGTWTGATGGLLNTAAGDGPSSITIANLGKDLTNDHPVGIAYCGGFETGDTTKANCTDKDFKVPSASGSTYFFDTSASGGLSTTTKDRSDILLYPNGTKQQVECGSCHDPHNDTSSSTSVAFLRVANNSSVICLACHDK